MADAVVKHNINTYSDLHCVITTRCMFAPPDVAFQLDHTYASGSVGREERRITVVTSPC